MNEIKLTEDQKEAVAKIKNFLNSSDGDIFTLSGVGGSGKTTSLREALKGVSNITGAAISHSAKFVLEQSLQGIAKCVTVAQLLGLVMHIEKDGDIKFIPNINRNENFALPIELADVIVIDECSMIDPTTFKLIITKKSLNAKVIFLGDPYQLPPIETSEDSHTFNYVKAELLKPIRYQGPIVQLGARIRAEIDKVNAGTAATKHVINEWMSELGHEERTSSVDENGSGYIFLNDINKVIEISTKIFKENDDSEAIKLLAYRNSNIEKLNDVLRAQTHGSKEFMVDVHDAEGNPILDEEGNITKELKLPQFMPGELVICNGGYSVPSDDGRMHNVIYNNQTFKVKETKEITGPLDIECLAMSLNPPVSMPASREIICLDWDNGRYKYFDQINNEKVKAKATTNWRPYYAFKNSFCWFDYNYAQNAHRA